MFMSEISEFADKYLFPAVYEMADKIFHEFNFKLHGDKLISGNKRKIDGTEGDRLGAVCIYEKTPHYLHDFRGRGKAITTYLQAQGKFSSWIEAIKYLAREVNIQLPERNLSEEEIERINKKERQAELSETTNDFFITSLLEETDSNADALRKYLDAERGYTEHLPKTHDDIHSGNKMELGFFPSQEKLKKHLKSKGFNNEEIENLFIKDTGFFPMNSYGATHQLTFPYRNHLGRITGFVLRNINHKEGEKLGKYLYTAGLSKTETLFMLTRVKNDRKELTIVEGCLDVMILKAKGVDNVAALGGVGFNTEQVKLAKQRGGAESITLWLDKDKTGIDSTDRAIEVIIKSDTGIKPYVVEIPSEYEAKDPDELIRKYEIDAYHKVIKTARPWYIYRLDKILSQIKGDITDKDRDHFLNKINQLARQLDNPIDREVYRKHVIANGAAVDISPDSLQKAMDKLSYELVDERRIAEIKKNIDKAKSISDDGNPDGALEILGNLIKQRNIISMESELSKLLIPITEDIIKERLQNKPEHLSSGLMMGGEELLIPSGALTIIAAPTSHGKTSFLINTALNAAADIETIQSNKSAYFFSYEESGDAILLKALNTYINKSLSKNNRRSIESYFKNGDLEFISSEGDCRSTFLYGKDNFFRYLIHSGRLNIFYSEYTSDDLIAALHYLHKHGNAGIIFIDYIQLLSLGSNKTGSRQEELKQICRDLKDCAVETGLPIVLGAQFNREATDETSIHSSKIGEAGDIERAANLIIGLWNNMFPAFGVKTHVPSPTVNATILKNRDGEAGIKETFAFDGNTGKISNNSIARF